MATVAAAGVEEEVHSGEVDDVPREKSSGSNGEAGGENEGNKVRKRRGFSLPLPKRSGNRKPFCTLDLSCMFVADVSPPFLSTSQLPPPSHSQPMHGYNSRYQLAAQSTPASIASSCL